jgi:phospholipid/cholesterol/gamma-HCH transport system substrate-binding protein
MNDRQKGFQVGVMVLACAILTATMVLIFGRFDLPWGNGTYTLYLKFEEAPGVTVDTPVRKSGILIGRVTDIALVDDGVLVTVAIDNDVRLRKTDIPSVGSTLLGDAMIHFVSQPQEEPPPPPVTPQSGEPIRPVRLQPGQPPTQAAPPPPHEQFLKEGDVIQGRRSSDPIAMLQNLQPDLSAMMQSVTRTSDNVNRMTDKLINLVDANDDQLTRVVDKAEKTLDTFREASENVNKLLGDPQMRANFDRSFAELPRVLEESRNAFKAMQETMQSANRSLSSLERMTSPLGDQSSNFFGRLDASGAKLERLLDDLSVFTQALNNREGSLGQFLHDPALYNNINSAAASIERLTRELRPIVNDVRVFTDKVARDPGRLGVRGIFQQNSGIK